jgi:aminoglycoside phosphotransferase (APT) family kinase protein
VYALDDARVLRRYRHGAGTEPEAQVMRYVGGLGYPVPAVHRAAGPDLVMERLDGGTMLQAHATGALSVPDGAAMLAGLLARLHALPPWPGAADGHVIVHLDLHPENIMLTSRGPVVIDWHNAGAGPGDLDTALSALIMAQVAVDPAQPLAAVAGAFLDVFVPLAPGDPVRLLDEAVTRRAGQATLAPAEVALLGDAAARVRAAAA